MSSLRCFWTGTTLRQARERVGWSREELGAAASRTGRTVQLWEADRVVPPRHVRVLLARLLHAPALVEVHEHPGDATLEEAVAELVARTTAEQGAPLIVEDPVTLERIAEIVTLARQSSQRGVPARNELANRE